ncbi:MAG: chemotaxis protein CheA [Oscillospiraceae bacterium]
MSSFDPSMKPMLEMFIYETTTILEQLDEIMLQAEKNKAFGGDAINEIFRFMHTIKGSSAMMGIASITTLAHAVEDVFYTLRETPDKINMINEAIFDIVFQASDYFKAEVDAIQDDDFKPQDPSSIITQLEEQVAIMNGVSIPVKSSCSPIKDNNSTAQKKQESEDELHQVRVFFADDCQMENIRSFMLLTQLKDWCDYIDSVPQNPENDSSLCDQIIRDGLLIKFKTSSKPQEVYSVIESSVNVKSYDIIEESEPQLEKIDDITPANDVPTPQAELKPVEAMDTHPLTAKSSHQLISVSQNKLDQLMDLVGELVTTESMVVSSPDLKGLELDNFNKSTRELRKLTDELQDVVMSMRMMPLSGVFQKMNRIVRDMSKKLQRKVELITIGGETEMDKTVNDVITDPFIHMIRNSMDHAIEQPEERIKLGKPETGTITISARNIGGEIVITIADDGRGLNKAQIMKKAKANGILTKPESEYTEKEIFNLIMLPGFSTKEAVTEFSGRGVGMDVVRKNIEKIGGTISVESTENVGTTFTIKIPLTLVIVDGMEISVGDTIFTLPITSIKQTFRLFDKNQIIYNINQSEMVMLRGECYPIIRLHDLYNIPAKATDLTSGILIQIETGDHVACLFVDELLGEQQVVVKPFPAYFNNNIKKSGLSGCTILGDGSISLILDASNIINCHSSTTR